MFAPFATAPSRALSRRPEAAPRERARRVVLIASLTSALVNFRLELLRSLVERGYEVVAVAPDHDEETIATLAAIGAVFRRIPMERTGLSLVRDLQTFVALYRLFADLRPDAILPFTMKPIIYGGLAARLAGVPHRFAIVTGLGYVFVDRERSARMAALRWLSVRLYRAALSGARCVFVYNRDDAAVLTGNAIAPEAAIRRIEGSGVDTALFPRHPVPEGPPVFLMVARLLRDKGVFEYAAAAALIRRRNPEVRCLLLGPFDSNPAAVPPADVERWVASGAIDYRGSTRDVRPFLAAASVFVLPSYREGLSRSVLEAMATGRAVITSDGPGCADPVAIGGTGLVVPVGDARALAAAMQSFVDDPAEARRMGENGRRRAEERYDVHRVNLAVLGEVDAALTAETATDGKFASAGAA